MAGIVACIVIGLVIVVVVAALGHCSSFGGRCPAEPGPLLEDDVFGTAAAGAALAVGGPMFLLKPSARRLGQALVVAAVVGVIVGLLARLMALG
jgi:hypothetical protein